jgi:hypothetical protein
MEQFQHGDNYKARILLNNNQGVVILTLCPELMTRIRNIAQIYFANDLESLAKEIDPTHMVWYRKEVSSEDIAANESLEQYKMDDKGKTTIFLQDQNIQLQRLFSNGEAFLTQPFRLDELESREHGLQEFYEKIETCPPKAQRLLSFYANPRDLRKALGSYSTPGSPDEGWVFRCKETGVVFHVCVEFAYRDPKNSAETNMLKDRETLFHVYTPYNPALNIDVRREFFRRLEKARREAIGYDDTITKESVLEELKALRGIKNDQRGDFYQIAQFPSEFGILPSFDYGGKLHRFYGPKEPFTMCNMVLTRAFRIKWFSDTSDTRYHKVTFELRRGLGLSEYDIREIKFHMR